MRVLETGVVIIISVHISFIKRPEALWSAACAGCESRRLGRAGLGRGVRGDASAGARALPRQVRAAVQVPRRLTRAESQATCFIIGVFALSFAYNGHKRPLMQSALLTAPRLRDRHLARRQRCIRGCAAEHATSEWHKRHAARPDEAYGRLRLPQRSRGRVSAHRQHRAASAAFCVTAFVEHVSGSLDAAEQARQLHAAAELVDGARMVGLFRRRRRVTLPHAAPELGYDTPGRLNAIGVQPDRSRLDGGGAGRRSLAWRPHSRSFERRASRLTIGRIRGRLSAAAEPDPHC